MATLFTPIPGRKHRTLSTPNEKYWKEVDELLAWCESKGILVFMFPGYVGYSSEKEEQGWMKELVANGSKTEQILVHGLPGATGTEKKNIVWMLLGDKGKYTEEQAKAEAALIRGLKMVEGQQSVQYTAESHSGRTPSR